MPKDQTRETKKEILGLWKVSPERVKAHDHGDIGTAALSFYLRLKDENHSVITMGTFGLGDEYQSVKVWVERWESTTGQYEPPSSEKALDLGCWLSFVPTESGC